MQQWEYLELEVTPRGTWKDSTGGEGKLTPLGPSGWLKASWGTLVPRLNALGADGWDLVTSMSINDNVRLLFKRPRRGQPPSGSETPL